MSEIKAALSNVQTPSFTKPEIMEKVKQLPQHIGAFSSQVAGHDYGEFVLILGVGFKKQPPFLRLAFLSHQIISDILRQNKWHRAEADLRCARCS